MRVLQNVADFVFGFDFFISYAHADGFEYAKALGARLQEMKYKVCLDRAVYHAGQDIGALTRRYVRNSNTLVVLAGPEALKSRWVLSEVKACLAAGRRAVPIDFRGTLTHAAATVPLKSLLENTLHIDETTDGHGTPSPECVNTLVASFQGVRQESFRARVIGGVALTTTALAGVATWQWREAVRQRDRAAARLVSQRVANGTRAAIDGDLWGAWSWFADALQLAQRADLDEHAHRQRLSSLRQQLPQLRQIWRLDDPAAAISPDGELAVLYSDRAKSLPVISIRASRKIAEIPLSGPEIESMRFSPDGRFVYILHRGAAEIRSVANGSLIAAHQNAKPPWRSVWLDAVTLAFNDDGTGHLFRFSNDAIEASAIPVPQNMEVRALSAAGDLAAYDRDSKKLLVFRAGATTPPLELSFELAPDALFSLDGHVIATAHRELLTFWSLGDVPAKIGEAPIAFSVDLEPAPGGRMLVVEEKEDDYRATQLWDLRQAVLVRTFDHDKITARWEFPAEGGGGAGGASGGGMSRVNPFQRYAVMSDDGSRLLTVSTRTKSWRIWDVLTGKALMPPHTQGGSSLRSVALSGDARVAVIAGSDGTVRAWDVALPRRVAPLIEHGDRVDLAGFTSWSELAYVSRRARWTLAWSRGDTKTSFDGEVREVEVGGGRWLVTRRPDSFAVAATASPEPREQWLEHKDVSDVTVSTNARYAVSWNSFRRDGRLRAWDVQKRAILADIPLGDHWIRATAVDEASPLAAFILSKDARYTLTTIDLADGSAKEHESHRPDALFFSDGANAMLTFDGEAFWRVRRDGISRFRENRSKLTVLRAVDDRGRLAVLTDRSRHVAQIVDVATGEPLTPAFWHEWAITSAVFSRDATLLATISGNAVHVWDVASGEAIVPVLRYDDTVTSVAIHPDNLVLAVATNMEKGRYRFAVFIESLGKASETADLLVKYGEASGGFRIDPAGGRVPLSVEDLAAAWSDVSAAGTPALVPRRVWYRQLDRETGSWNDRHYLDRILEIEPNDVEARARRATLVMRDAAAFVDQVERLRDDGLLEVVQLDPATAYQWCDVLLRNNRARDAYAVLSHQRSEDREHRREWWLAMLSQAAGDPRGRRRHCLAARRDAESASQDEPIDRWNAAVHAARACILSDEDLDDLRAMTQLAASCAPPSQQKTTIPILLAAVALRSSDAARAKELLAAKENYPLARALAAELAAREGNAAKAEAELSFVRTQLPTLDTRRSWPQATELRLLIDAIEKRLRSKAAG